MHVSLLEDSDDLRFLMKELIEVRFALDCVTFGSVADLKADATTALASAIAFLDINLGEGRPSGIDAYHWLTAEGFRGKIYFFTGHALRHPAVESAVSTGVGILLKPVSVQELADILEPLRASR